ncbi:MAG: hypothetical protein GY851_07905 [bacterium]|nr:hypothetical protein [bacterium]
MSPAKRFMTVYIVAYLAIAIGATVVFGGPNLSDEYVEDFGRDHETYLDIIKSDPYKLHRENPNLHPAEGKLVERVAFVEEYEANPAFISEEHRLATRSLFYEFYNALAFIIIAVRFGKKPLLNAVDEQIARLKARIDKAQKASDAAAASRTEAETKVQALDTDKARIADQAAEAAREETAAIDTGTTEQLAQVDAETEARKKQEERKAAAELQRRLVERSVELVEERLRATESGAREDVLVAQFAEGLDQARNGTEGAS